MTVASKSKGKQVELTAYQKSKRKKEFNGRNEIEGKFGQAKQGYGLNQISLEDSYNPILTSKIRII